MRTSAILAFAAAALVSAQQYGSPMTTIETTSTATVVKTVYAATHTTTVSLTGANATVSSGFAHPTGANSTNMNSSSQPTVPITLSSAADVVKANAAQGALVGAIMIGVLLF